jgi:DNA polymerase I
MEELYLIDGYSVIYRSYFAMIRKPLLNPEGRNSSAVYGFFRALFHLIRTRSPARLAVVMDSRVPTFRHERYPAYKANREKTPADLHAQVGVIERILAALEIPCVRADGFEADDVIATLSERCQKAGIPCWILSGDKDILQLVQGFVRVLSPEKGIADLTEHSRETVHESRGVYPEQIVDFLSLTGDQSDNVPGVKGIGEKTARKLFTQFDSLDALYAALDQVEPESVRRKLEEGRESALLSRELILLRRDVPGVPLPEALGLPVLDRAAALPLFEREGMKTMVAELGVAPFPAEKSVGTATVMAGTAPGTYETVIDASQLDRWLAGARQAGIFSLDTETDGIDEMHARPVGFSLSYREGEACYIPVRAKDAVCLPEKLIREKLAALLEDPAMRIVGQNFKFDYKVLRRWGVRPANVWFDTMVASWILDSGQTSYGLDRMAERLLQFRTLPYTDLVPKGSDATLADVPVARVTDYSGEDADLTLRLCRILDRDVRAAGMEALLRDLEMPLVEILSEMELAGIRVLPAELTAYGSEIESQLAVIEADIYSLCGTRFNINSTKQLQEVLFTSRKLKPVKKTKTGWSTDTDVLEILAAEDPVPEKILAHRKLSKLKSTYVDALPGLVNPDTGRVHTHFVQTGTATGRLSSKDPNLQNIPIRDEEGRRIRSAFVPAAGMCLLSADYAQIELAILAHLSQDPALLTAFREGRDIHRQTAALIFAVPEAEVSPEQRRVGKTINFGVVYGMSAYGLSQSLKISRADADRFIKTYFERLPGVAQYLAESVRSAREKGYAETLFGRRRRVQGIASENKTERMQAERVAVNSPIQGTAADIVKLAMGRLHRRLRDERLSARILLQVHDEMILEVPEEETKRVEALVREAMETATDRGVPLKVTTETGRSWGEFH